MKLKPGTRVRWWRGEGTVVEFEPGARQLFKQLGWTNVLFDKAPPREFNMGVNPTCVTTIELEVIE